MSWIDDNWDQIVWDMYNWRNKVNDFIENKSNEELMKMAKKVVESLNPKYMDDMDKKEVIKILNIISFGTCKRYLSNKQRYVLGEFILKETR